MADTFKVVGSHGTLTVHRYSGAVLAYDDPDGDGEYSDIVRFNVSEARAHYGADFDAFDEWDILFLDFWTVAGTYVENEREAVAAIHAELEEANR